MKIYKAVINKKTVHNGWKETVLMKNIDNEEDIIEPKETNWIELKEFTIFLQGVEKELTHYREQSKHATNEVWVRMVELNKDKFNRIEIADEMLEEYKKRFIK